MAKTVLITGGAGFIGSHLTEEYSRRGYEVVIIDDLSSGIPDNMAQLKSEAKVHFYDIDIRNAQELEEVCQKHSPAIINHHAAQKSVSDSVVNPHKDLDINLKGLLNLIGITSRLEVENFIYVSSGGALSKEITGDQKSREVDFPQLVSPYAITKFAGENYIRNYAQLHNFNYTILRYGNVYGPRQIADGECGVIPIFVDNILAQRPSTLMTYEDMPRGCTRDYIYVDDVVEINMLVSEKPTNQVYNISSGEEQYILDIYEKIAKQFGANPGIKIVGPRLGDVRRSVLDNSKAKAELNWEAKVTLEEGLRRLYEYLKNGQ